MKLVYLVDAVNYKLAMFFTISLRYILYLKNIITERCIVQKETYICIV